MKHSKNTKLTDMHLIYGLTEGNARATEILYRDRYPQRDAPNNRICLRGANNRVVMIANSWLVLSVMVRDLVPLKTRCVEGPIHVRSITARSPHVDMMWKMESGVQAQVSSLSLDRRSKGRGPSPVAFE
ncbi:hypothetical protein TNCV_3129991 [Trichonephila clavipes]|nr:hypothetical protein TNCV_3129991 [Trichonephila clavipes]